MRRIPAWLMLAAALFVGWEQSNAQCGDADSGNGVHWKFDESESTGFALGRLLGNLVTPQLIQDTRAIRSYVRDQRFADLSRLCGEMRTVDAIYQKALRIAEYEISRALFLGMMATLEHQNIEFRVPVIGSIGVPLTFEEDSLFQRRIRNLPRRLYHDSPSSGQGDRDKLQHFFGSAYLAYVSESQTFARSTGNMIEWGEAKFVVGGADDPRDRRANKQGEMFGHHLLTVRNLLPSDYLRIPVDE